jgi:predicted O-linked N-acetylglucosamine transferase (SPINDLY family)
MLQLWAQILHFTPGSKLLIKAKALQSQSAIRRVHEIMQSAGITPDRLDLQGWRKSHQDHLAAYRNVHIALDTFPYHGTTTTRDALWMGVPVVTLAGQSHVSRVGVSLLTNVGLHELIANSQEQYVQIATKLARDLPHLNDLRSILRKQMEQSPLMDAPRFARNIEAAYRQMWHTWCQTGSGKS